MRSRFRTLFVTVVAVLAMTAMTAAPALASGKPLAETKPATVIKATQGRLNGTVNPEGLETKYHFEYGTTMALGSNTAEASAGSGAIAVEVNKTITGLTEGTKYYFRITATNSSGTAFGTLLTFTPTKLPEFHPWNEHEKMTGEIPSGPEYKTGYGRVKYSSGSVAAGTEVLGPSELLHIAMRFKQPTEEACTNTEGKTLALNALNGRLGYINKAKTEVGLLLEPPTQPVVKCSGIVSQEWTGSMIGKITPLNQRTTQFKVVFRQIEGEKFEHFEGEEALHHLTDHYSETENGLTLNAELNLTSNVSIEIKA